MQQGQPGVELNEKLRISRKKINYYDRKKYMRLINDRTQVEIKINDPKYARIKQYLAGFHFIYFVKDSALYFSAESIDSLISKIDELKDKKVVTAIILARLLMLKIEKETPQVVQQSLQSIRNNFDVLEKQIAINDAEFATASKINLNNPIEAVKKILQDIHNFNMQSVEQVLERGERIHLLVDRQEQLSNTSVQFKQKPGFWARLFCCNNNSSEKGPLLISTNVPDTQQADRINDKSKRYC